MGHERRALCDRASTSAIRRSDETRAALQYVAKGHKATWRALFERHYCLIWWMRP